MADIIHRLQMNASPAQVYSAITEQAGLSGWWARSTRTAPCINALAEFRLGDAKAVVKMRVADLKDGARVAWRCVDGPADWIGTEVMFDLAAEGEKTVVRFVHRNWREATDFMGDCSAKWAFFLFSLKSALETPEPDDVMM